MCYYINSAHTHTHFIFLIISARLSHIMSDMFFDIQLTLPTTTSPLLPAYASRLTRLLVHKPSWFVNVTELLDLIPKAANKSWTFWTRCRLGKETMAAFAANVVTNNPNSNKPFFIMVTDDNDAAAAACREVTFADEQEQLQHALTMKIPASSSVRHASGLYLNPAILPQFLAWIDLNLSVPIMYAYMFGVYETTTPPVVPLSSPPPLYHVLSIYDVQDGGEQQVAITFDKKTDRQVQSKYPTASLIHTFKYNARIIKSRDLRRKLKAIVSPMLEEQGNDAAKKRSKNGGGTIFKTLVPNFVDEIGKLVE